MEKYIFGIDIGGTTVKCGLFTVAGELLDKWEIPTRRENAGAGVLPDVAETIEAKLAEKQIAKVEVVGIGLGIPGPVKADGTVLKCANLGWGIVNAVEEMQGLTGLKVAAANDANVAALGEMWKGGGRGYQDVIMVTLGTGVGGGVIVDGKVIAGSNGAGGEIGHIIVNPQETALCGCGGHGHLEQYASATGIVRMAKKRLAEEETPTKLREFAELTAKDIFDCAKAGDTVAEELVDMLGSYLAAALSHVAATVDPQVFVIGGGVSKAGQILLDAISRHYNDNILFALKNKEFRLAELGNDAGIYGSARLLITN
ncbi:MAG: ROK family glucokinase [Lachnospiraceae bacterium]|nr:ROK family glucokinase [Lachnospiraceae bacterium]